MFFCFNRRLGVSSGRRTCSDGGHVAAADRVHLWRAGGGWVLCSDSHILRRDIHACILLHFCYHRWPLCSWSRSLATAPRRRRRCIQWECAITITCPWVLIVSHSAGGHIAAGDGVHPRLAGGGGARHRAGVSGQDARRPARALRHLRRGVTLLCCARRNARPRERSSEF